MFGDISQLVLTPKWFCIWLINGFSCFTLLTNQGRPGCKNIRAGGDTVHEELADDNSRYCTYVVYRSFRHPPPVPPMKTTIRSSATASVSR